jgi:hypothetical protein
MTAQEGWVTVWDRETRTERKVDPATAKSLLTSERFTTEKPADDTAAEDVTDSAPGQPAVVNLTPT